MPRFARVVAAGLPHHITQRGNERRRVFLSPLDYRLYIKLLNDRIEKCHLRLLGYCLMPNHVHFIAIPEETNSLAEAFGRVHCDYARYLHMQRDQTGHLWQNRFYSCVLDEAHCWQALAYVERNPVRAGLCENAAIYEWSSAAAHCGGSRGALPLDVSEWRARYTERMWREALTTSLNEAALIERLRSATRTGRPLGGDGFVSELGRRLGRDLVKKKSGRPARKNQETGSLSLSPEEGEQGGAVVVGGHEQYGLTFA